MKEKIVDTSIKSIQSQSGIESELGELSDQDRDNKIKELRNQIRLRNEKLMSGKCPMRVVESGGKILWKESTYKDQFSDPQSVFKHLTGTSDIEVANEILWKGVCALPGVDRVNAEKYNIVLQSLADIEPKDSFEARLCLQATSLYSQGMTYISRAERSDRIDVSDYYMRNAIKLLRLHNETVEAFNKHRRRGEQKLTVQHQYIQVNGGQTVVKQFGEEVNKINIEVPHEHS